MAWTMPSGRWSRSSSSGVSMNSRQSPGIFDLVTLRSALSPLITPERLYCHVDQGLALCLNALLIDCGRLGLVRDD